jgi:uracil-DNA glycosylase family 4
VSTPMSTVVPQATTWGALSIEMSTCTACRLSESRTNVVPGMAPPGARILLVGEAPGRSEDEGGLPFVGRSGQLLDRVLAEVGLDRSTLAVVNTVKCRPPDNRTPTRSEQATCRPWLDAQVRAVDPAVVVTLGGTALAWALGRSVRIGEVHGSVHRLPQLGDRALVPTYHPSAALRFGPAGAPLQALRADLALVAELASGAQQC